MGRIDHSAARVHKYASQLLQANRIPARPPWYDTIGTVPPPSKLVRPVLQRPQKSGKKASKMFSPVQLSYEEDRLRWEYFNDHPWELARSRVILENDGRDRERWDWSHALCRPEVDEVGLSGLQAWEKVQEQQASRPLNGEAVVQRQHWLMRHAGLTEAAAYDKARKELYRTRHAREVEQRVAREEAMAYGGFFGASPLEIGAELEDRQIENWKAWAKKEIQTQKQLQGSAYTGTENEEAEAQLEEADDEVLQQVGERVPASKSGQMAMGGAAVHP